MLDILIVEDGAHEREMLEQLFSKQGYSVMSAETASDANDLLMHKQFRLAILDIGLGDQSGSHTFKLIQQFGEIDFVLILTGNPSVHLKQKFLDEGAAAYIVKGSADAEGSALLERIQLLLGRPISQE